MVQTLNMQDLMQLNLFTKITGVKTSHIFKYNNIVFFGVPSSQLKKALGKDASNLRRVGNMMRKRVRIVPVPSSKKTLGIFFEKITEPIVFKEVIDEPNEIIINAGSMNKAALIGRDKIRLMELQKIARDFFDKNLRVI